MSRNWPNPSATAAGWRVMQLISFFREENFQVHFAAAQTVEPVNVFDHLSRFQSHQITLNDDSFDMLITELSPEYVIFDRFMTEEQYGWRVRACCPEAVTILDTEDCHFLRSARADYVRANPVCFEAVECCDEDLYSSLAIRELASIWRCDLSLIISQYEYDLLTQTFSVPEGILHYLPLVIDNSSNPSLKKSEDSNLKTWKQRRDFLWIGNRQHNPNDDSLKFLLRQLWPAIHDKLPDAELHIVGPNGTPAQNQLIKNIKSVIDFGWVDDLNSLSSCHRVNLAPLRFGAGLKGKVLQSLGTGLPTVSSTIAAEGLFIDDLTQLRPAKNESEFIAKSVSLYTNAAHWKTAQINGIQHVEQNFSKAQVFTDFKPRISSIKHQLKRHRQAHFMGQILQYQSLNASKYMGRWLTLKGKQLNPK